MIRTGGFSLAEVMVAAGLLAVVLLALMGLITSTLSINQKASLLGPATQVCDSLIQRTIYQVSDDSPAGTHDSFWNHSAATPWRGPLQENIGGVDYKYVLYASDAKDTGGVPLGGTAPGNRVKKLDLDLWWWDRQKSHYGRLEIQGTRLVHEASSF